MRKFGMLFIGIIIGVGLTLSPQIYGAGTKLIGSTVDKTMNIKLNGKLIGQGGVIAGTNYLPVRSVAKALGLEVNVEGNTVNLVSQLAEDNAKAAQEWQDAADKKTNIEILSKQIQASEKRIVELKDSITSSESNVSFRKESLDYINSNKEAPADSLDYAKKMYDNAIKVLNKNKSDLAAEQNNLKDLEAQLAALQ